MASPQYEIEYSDGAGTLPFSPSLQKNVLARWTLLKKMTLPPPFTHFSTP